RKVACPWTGAGGLLGPLVFQDLHRSDPRALVAIGVDPGAAPVVPRGVIVRGVVVVVAPVIGVPVPVPVPVRAVPIRGAVAVVIGGAVSAISIVGGGGVAVRLVVDGFHLLPRLHDLGAGDRSQHGF